MIGIYGGTFNPIHLGHLRAAEEVVEALGLDRMLFIPSARPPHKRDEIDETAPARMRLEWVELAVRENPCFVADAIEVDRPGPSYLVDTLRALRDRYPADELTFVVGQDAFSEMGTWRAPREIFRLAHVAVTTRPPVVAGSIAEWLPGCVAQDFDVDPNGARARHRDGATLIRQVAVTPIDISASDIRARLRAGRSIRYLLPEAVRVAVLASGVYSHGGSDEVATGDTSIAPAARSASGNENR
jgi:nicotinate-nucleotide adenylyltransferase